MILRQVKEVLARKLAHSEKSRRIPLIFHPFSLIDEAGPNGPDPEYVSGWINPVHLHHAPKSASDLGILNSCRALSSALLTSGKNIRLEKEWTIGFFGDEKDRAEYEQFRFEAFGERKDMKAIILSNGNPFCCFFDNIDLETRTKFTVLSPKIDSKMNGVHYKKCRHLTLSKVLQYCSRKGLSPICLETGPSTFLPFYQQVDVSDKYQLVMPISVFKTESLSQELKLIKPKIDLKEIKSLQSLYIDADFTDPGPNGHWRYLIMSNF